MASVYFIGKATAVAQVHTGSIDSVDGTPANNTFTVTIGGVAISQVGDTDVATTAAALVVLLNASTHPYFAAITWTNPSAGNIVGTADNAGVPFVAALTETGAGSGAVTDFAETTASAGPNDWSTATNWSGGSVPSNNDDVVVDVDVPILWGLDQSSVALDSLRFGRNFKKLGLPAGVFTTDADGDTTNDSYVEYRDTYLQIGVTAADGPVTIGENLGGGSAGDGAQRIKLDLGSTAATVEVHYTQSASSESDLPVVRMLANSASTNVFLRQGLLGIAVENNGETSTINDVVVADVTEDSTTLATIGPGVTMADFEAGGGTHRVRCACTNLTARSGTTTTEGEGAITTATADGDATLVLNSTGTVTNAVADGGTIDEHGSDAGRTVTNPKVTNAGTYKWNPKVTHTNELAPQERMTLTAA